MVNHERTEPDFETPKDDRIVEVDIDAGKIDIDDIRQIGERLDVELDRLARGDPWWTDVQELK